MGLSQNFRKVLSLDHPAASVMVFMGVLPDSAAEVEVTRVP